MEMEITFPGGARVDAGFGSFTVQTDQSPAFGGEGSAPSPFALFLTSIGTCAGIYVLEFLQHRDLPTDDVRLIQHVDRNESTGMVEQIRIEIQVPEGFPEKYLPSLKRAAELCSVKKHLQHPPQFDVRAVMNGNSA